MYSIAKQRKGSEVDFFGRICSYSTCMLVLQDVTRCLLKVKSATKCKQI